MFDVRSFAFGLAVCATTSLAAPDTPAAVARAASRPAAPAPAIAVRSRSQQATSAPPPSPTAVPTLDPTPRGGPIVVGVPLATPTRAADAIAAGNAFEVAEAARWTPPTEGTEVLVAISPDGRVYYTVSGLDVLVARAMPDGAILWRRYMEFRSYWPALALSPDGRVLASTDYESLVLLDTATGEPLRRHASRSRLWGLTFTRDGRRLAELAGDAYAAAWDVATGDLLADRQIAPAADVSPRLRPGFVEVSAVPWPANNLSVWDIPTGAIRWTAALPLAPDARIGDRSAWSDDGRYVAWPAYGKGRSGAARDWICRSDLVRAPTCAPMAVYGGAIGSAGWALAVSDDGRVVVGGERHSHPGVCQRLGVEVSDGQGAARTVFDAPGRSVDDIEWSPDGALVAVSHRACRDGADPRTTLIAVDPGIAVATLAGAERPRFTPDGAGLFATDGGALRLYRVRPGSGRSRRVFLPVTWVGR